MDLKEISQRLDAQERLLHAIVAALAPPEQEASTFDDLVETLSDLTQAVADVTDVVRALHWGGSGLARQPAAPPSVDG